MTHPVPASHPESSFGQKHLSSFTRFSGFATAFKGCCASERAWPAGGDGGQEVSRLGSKGTAGNALSVAELKLVAAAEQDSTSEDAAAAVSIVPDSASKMMIE